MNKPLSDEERKRLDARIARMDARDKQVKENKKTVMALVKADKLSFEGDHQTNTSYQMEHDPEYFAKSLHLQLYWSAMNEEEGIVLDRSSCHKCGEYITFKLEGNKFVPNVKKCFTDKEVTVDIHFPTGELLLNDWPHLGQELLLDMLNLDEDEDGNGHNINCDAGVASRIKSYAKHDIMHFFVGNSCPGLYKKDNLYGVGNMSYACDEEGNEEDEVPPIEGGDKLGSICTDLWWFTAIDKETYSKLANQKFGDEAEAKIAEAVEHADEVIQVEPGTYRLTYFVNQSDDSSLYGTFTKID